MIPTTSFQALCEPLTEDNPNSSGAVRCTLRNSFLETTRRITMTLASAAIAGNVSTDCNPEKSRERNKQVRRQRLPLRPLGWYAQGRRRDRGLGRSLF